MEDFLGSSNQGEPQPELKTIYNNIPEANEKITVYNNIPEKNPEKSPGFYFGSNDRL